MKIAFVLNDLRLSGGVNVILQHSSRIASRGKDEVFLLVRESGDGDWAKPLIGQARILEEHQWGLYSFDVAIATYWETLLLLGHVQSLAYIWFCQLFEDRFFPDRNPNISTMQIAGSIPIPVLTEAHWLRDLIHSQNPGRAVKVVLNGVDKAIFNELDASIQRMEGFSVLIEGALDSIAKNTSFAIEGTLLSRCPTTVTHVGDRPYETHDSRYIFIQNGLSFEDMAHLYRSHHVQVKTPLAEGMFGPPLEGFHCGLPAIVTPVSGAEEYIEDEANALVVLWDDPRGLARAIDTLATDPKKWAKLQDGARRTAADWPAWDSQATQFRRAISELAKSSRLSRDDLAHLGQSIQFAHMMHWLAMRRLSDKDSGPRVMEELAFGPVKPNPSLARRVVRKLQSLWSRQ